MIYSRNRPAHSLSFKSKHEWLKFVIMMSRKISDVVGGTGTLSSPLTYKVVFLKIE